MCMTIAGTKACNRYIDRTFSQLYKFRSDMMEKQIHQHWGQGNLDDPKQNISSGIAISSILMNPQLVNSLWKGWAYNRGLDSAKDVPTEG